MTAPQPRVHILPILTRAVISVAFIAAGVAVFSWLYWTRAQPPASDPSATGRLRLLVSEPFELDVGR